VRTAVQQKFEQSKDAEARYLINLLENIIPLVLDFYPVIFRSGNWLAYREAMFRVWAIFYQYNRKNYNKLPLAFLSDVFYWLVLIILFRRLLQIPFKYSMIIMWKTFTAHFADGYRNRTHSGTNYSTGTNN
jgi:hypothetical protein